MEIADRGMAAYDAGDFAAGLPSLPLPCPAPFWEIMEITNRGMAAYDAGDFAAALTSLPLPCPRCPGKLWKSRTGAWPPVTREILPPPDPQPTPSWGIMEITDRSMAAYDAGDFAAAPTDLRKAAAQGHADAQNNLGVMYEYGRGVAKNYKEAMKWYRKASNQDNFDAWLSLIALKLWPFGK